MKNLSMVLLALLVMAILAACSPAATTNNGGSEGETAVMADKPADTAEEDAMMAEDDHAMAEDSEMMAEDDDMKAEEDAMMAEDDHAMTEDDAMMAEDDHAMTDLPAWQTISLTNARTGESFKLADFAGKTVFVEPMATWCTNCRQQLGNVRQATTQAGDDVIFVALSLETNLSNGDLAAYADDAGFDWLFAVMTPEMLQSLADTFGRSITSAPSTPHFVIRPDGSYTSLVTGIESPEEILGHIQAASG